MKAITIGRDPGCDITIDDKMISRRHAILKIYMTGKMELVDMSSNGTFVNGVKLAGNVPFPVKRKDKVSFAHVKQLNWKLVPNPLAWIKWALISLCSIAVIVAGVLVYNKYCKSDESYVIESGTVPNSNQGSAEGSDKGESKVKNDSDTLKSQVPSWAEKIKADEQRKMQAVEKKQSKNPKSKEAKKAEDKVAEDQFIL